MRESTLDLPFGRLAGLEWGEPHRPPVLALHGWLDNAAGFAAVAPLLAECHRVIALDLPGHGRSAHLPSGVARYHATDYVDHVLNAADALRLDRFALLGHSLGAGVASLVAAAAPARVRKLALIEGLGPLADDGSNTLQRWRDSQAQRSVARRAPRVFASIDEALAARVAVGDLLADEARALVMRGLRAVDGGWVWSSDARLRLPTPLRIEESQLRRLLAGIEAPTLLLLADPQTPYLPHAMMAARAACVRDIRVERVAGRHHLHLQHPREVAERLSRFLGSQPKGTLPAQPSP
ncbi:MAG: alpha/beta fold hydrolase [Proteobacteria bacterium]|nr:alpha/beta fold hydrolase [Pseudomonadota bacterium]